MDPKDGRVVSNFIVQALQGQPLTIYGDGSQTRSFCYVDDLIEGLVRLMESNYQEPMNLGNPNEYTVMELAEAVSIAIGAEVKTVYKQLPVDDPKQRCPDISRAKETIGWTPFTSLEDGLKASVEWFKSALDLS